MLEFHTLHPNLVLALCRSFWAGLSTARSCPLGAADLWGEQSYKQLVRMAEPCQAQDNPGMVSGQFWDSFGTPLASSEGVAWVTRG